MTQRVEGGLTTTIQWNYDNKPTSITKGSTTVAFTYDGNSQRVRKQSSVSGTTLYFGELYETRGGVGTIHVFARNQRVISVFLDGTTQFYHTNHLGSASVVTNQNGDRKEQIEYFPFGTYRAVGDPLGTYDYDATFPDVFYTFTGQEDDDELGLYNYKARLYDPLLGRFISPDSIVPNPEDPQSLNRYSYCLNNPLKYTDPSGHEGYNADSFASDMCALAATTSGLGTSAFIGGESGVANGLSNNASSNQGFPSNLINSAKNVEPWPWGQVSTLDIDLIL